MTIFDILKGLKEADDNTQSIRSQATSDYSPYIKSAQATDRLGYGKIVLIDFCQYTFLYISPSIFSTLLNVRVIEVDEFVIAPYSIFVTIITSCVFAVENRPNTEFSRESQSFNQ